MIAPHGEVWDPQTQSPTDRWGLLLLGEVGQGITLSGDLICEAAFLCGCPAEVWEHHRPRQQHIPGCVQALVQIAKTSMPGGWRVGHSEVSCNPEHARGVVSVGPQASSHFGAHPTVSSLCDLGAAEQANCKAVCWEQLSIDAMIAIEQLPSSQWLRRLRPSGLGLRLARASTSKTLKLAEQGLVERSLQEVSLPQNLQSCQHPLPHTLYMLGLISPSLGLPVEAWREAFASHLPRRQKADCWKAFSQGALQGQHLPSAVPGTTNWWASTS